MSDHGPLLFVDTNIFLDFYRATGSADFKLLGRLNRVQENIITSHQVEMEFQRPYRRDRAPGGSSLPRSDCLVEYAAFSRSDQKQSFNSLSSLVPTKSPGTSGGFAGLSFSNDFERIP